jgi:hypothetical protein
MYQLKRRSELCEIHGFAFVCGHTVDCSNAHQRNSLSVGVKLPIDTIPALQHFAGLLHPQKAINGFPIFIPENALFAVTRLIVSGNVKRHTARQHIS